jgi:hypothetical protein
MFNALQVDLSIQLCIFIETESDEKKLASKTSNVIEFLENNEVMQVVLFFTRMANYHLHL